MNAVTNHRRLRALLGALCLSLAACQTEEAPPSAPLAQDVAGVQARLEELRGRLGEDAYGQPEIEDLIRTLYAIPSGAPDHAQAQRLLAELRARYKLAKDARDGERHDPTPKVPSYGALKMEGQAPSTPEQRTRAEDVKEGTSRAQLLAAYGTCLTRQTWFLGRNGGPTTELFHVAPECRDQMTPRIFQVSDDKVVKVTAGHLDELQAAPPIKRDSSVDLHRPLGRVGE